MTRVSLLSSSVPLAIVDFPGGWLKEVVMNWKKGPGDFARAGRGVLAAGLIVVIGGIAAAADEVRA